MSIVENKSNVNKLSILSYNIHKGNSFFTRQKVLPQIRSFIFDVDADIVCLQEVRDFFTKEEKLYGKSQLSFLSNDQRDVVGKYTSAEELIRNKIEINKSINTKNVVNANSLQNSLVKSIKSTNEKIKDNLLTKFFLKENEMSNSTNDLKNDLNVDLSVLNKISDNIVVPYENFYGKNAIYKNGHHGNAILSKYPTLNSQNFDLTVSPLEYRGVLINQLNIKGKEVYVLCTHLNLRKSDRLKQISLLENIIQEQIPKGSNIVLVGDFNDFDNSIEKYFKRTHNFSSIEGKKTYPNVFPILSPDKILTQNIELGNVRVFKDSNLLKLSDHLPILSELYLK